jgi:hypothetical protein
LPKEEFLELYESFFIERKKYSKGDPTNYMYKILLNSSYGLSNDKNSFLYDPLFTLQITINGQLLLSMLGEALSKIESLKFLQWNTDGLTFKVKRSELDVVNTIFKNWEILTKLSLETNIYDKMIINDVNNYIAVDNKEEIKRKGVFEWSNLPLNKNKSYLIIPIALENYFLKNIPIKTTLENHTNIYDFCRGIKSKWNSLYEFMDLSGTLVEIQKVNRYFICKSNIKDRGKIVKKYKDGRTSLVEATSYYQKVINNCQSLDKKQLLNEIDFRFYERECEKLISNIIGRNILF